MKKSQATLKGGGKTIFENIDVEFTNLEYSPTRKLLRGSFNITPEIGNSPLPSLYELVLKDGRSHQIVIMGLHPKRVHPRTKGDSTTLVDFVGAMEG
jgi:hypothetical protein